MFDHSIFCLTLHVMTHDRNRDCCHVLCFLPFCFFFNPFIILKDLQGILIFYSVDILIDAFGFITRL